MRCRCSFNWQSNGFVNRGLSVRLRPVALRDGETVSQRTLDPLFYVQIVVPELLARSSMVELAAVNRPVVGSSPTEPVLESWPSGLRQRFTKPPRVKILRGFESLRFRFGELPKRSTGADCKSAGFCLRGFESLTHHVHKRLRTNLAGRV